jgi:hypothetical protein
MLYAETLVECINRSQKFNIGLTFENLARQECLDAKDKAEKVYADWIKKINERLVKMCSLFYSFLRETANFLCYILDEPPVAHRPG